MPGGLSSVLRARTGTPDRTGVAVRSAHLPTVIAVAGSLAAVPPLVALAGWISGHPLLASLVSDQPTMKVNTAIALLLIAVSWTLPARFVPWLAGASLLIGALTVVEHISGRSLGIDQLLISDAVSGAHAGRPSVLATAGFVLLALSRLFAWRGHRRWTQGAALVAASMAALALVGYAYDLNSLRGGRALVTVSLPTALSTIALGIAALAAVDGGAMTWAVRSSDAGAALVRRLLPLALFGVPVTGYVCLTVQRWNWVTGTATVALLVVLNSLAVGLLTWVAGNRISRVDRRRARALVELTQLKDGLERQVQERASQLRRRSDEVAVLEDRQRIAADLHDIVIQRLYAAGMYLQGGALHESDPQTLDRMRTAIEAMDTAIRDLRHSIFELGGLGSGHVDLTTAIDDVCRDSAHILGFEPDLVVDDPDLDADAVREDVLAVLREALANVARHAEATAAHVELRVAQGEVVLTVTDNGKGMGEITRSSGTRNIAERAEHFDGTCTWTDATPRGTRLRWRVPVLAVRATQGVV